MRGTEKPLGCRNKLLSANKCWSIQKINWQAKQCTFECDCFTVQYCTMITNTNYVSIRSVLLSFISPLSIKGDTLKYIWDQIKTSTRTKDVNYLSNGGFLFLTCRIFQLAETEVWNTKIDIFKHISLIAWSSCCLSCCELFMGPKGGPGRDLCIKTIPQLAGGVT